MSDITSDDEQTAAVLTRLTKPLFKKPIIQSEGHIDEKALLYGITVNVQPSRLMNKKQWRQYSHDAQRSQLLRIEQASRKGMPSIELIEMHFEVCPTLKNIHFHALYRMPACFVIQLEAFYARIIGNIGHQTKPWRYLDVKLIKNGESNWVQYIRKDQS